MDMENKTYALVCFNEDRNIVSMTTSKDADKLVAKMKSEYESKLSCFREEGIEISCSNFLSERKIAYIFYGLEYSYFWEIKEIMNLDWHNLSYLYREKEIFRAERRGVSFLVKDKHFVLWFRYKGKKVGLRNPTFLFSMRDLVKMWADLEMIFYLSQIKNSVNASKIFPYKNNFTYFVKHFPENVWRIKIKALYLH